MARGEELYDLAFGPPRPGSFTPMAPWYEDVNLEVVDLIVAAQQQAAHNARQNGPRPPIVKGLTLAGGNRHGLGGKRKPPPKTEEQKKKQRDYMRAYRQRKNDE